MRDYLSEDELAQILRLLPVKTILRFRCVSKRWKQLIDSPFFIRSHLAIQTPRFLVQDQSFRIHVADPEFPSLTTLHPPFQDRKLEYYGTHNGLVCLYDSVPSDLLVWNPAIRRLKTVHLPKTMSSWRYLDRDFSCFGFWINPSTREFKFIVLNLMGERGNHPMVSAIRYSSVLQMWEAVPTEQLAGLNWVPAHQGPPVMVQGVAHWRGYDFEAHGFILSYDFILESFHLIQMPTLRSSPFGPTHFRWRGKLSLLHWDRVKPYRFNMYTTTDQGLWARMSSFDFTTPITGVFWVLGDQQRFKILARALSKLVLYDSRDRLIHFMDDPLSSARLNYHAFFSYDFVQTLLSP